MKRERIVQFGPKNGLCGIFSPGDESQPKIALLFSNAGIVHRVGPNRIFVELARRAARRGLASFRFDVSGLGDSKVRSDGQSYSSSRIEEARAAMDHLEQTEGITKFIFIGLCSGADHAFRVSVVDSRVQAAVFLDGYAYRTLGWYWHHYAPRFFGLQSWKNVATGKHPMWDGIGSILRRFLKGKPDSTSGSVPSIPTFVMDIPSRSKTSADIAKMLERKAKLLFIYTADMCALYNHRQQFIRSFPELKSARGLNVWFEPQVDHTLTDIALREELYIKLLGWFDTVVQAEKGLTLIPPTQERREEPAPALVSNA